MSSSTTSNYSQPFGSPMTDDELFFSLSRELKPSAPTKLVKGLKSYHTSTILGKVGSFSFEVLDTLGSSMAELFSYSGVGFASDLRELKVSILAFEVANTIVKGYSLMESLTDGNIGILLKEIFLLQGLQLLVSTDEKELLRIAAADKREEFEIFYREVMRFGDMCKDHMWHNLDRTLSKKHRHEINKISREEAEITMQELTNLAERTSELYHECHALDRLEQVYRCKLEGVDLLHLRRKGTRKGESLTILQSELKHQRKLLRNLKKKSLWSKNLEEVVEKLVEIVTFIHQAIAEAFDKNAASLTQNDQTNDKKTEKTPKSLGVSGLALHYANLITQIDNIVSRPTCLNSDVRDTLYRGLPASVKAGVRSRLQALDPTEVMTMTQIKAEMEKTLRWLVPMAASTIKAHQCFGWVGEWANNGFEFGKKTAIRLQTLYHADKHIMDQYILHLVILLHRLIYLANVEIPTLKKLPMLPNRGIATSKRWITLPDGELQQAKVTLDKRFLSEKVTECKTMVFGRSKSQEFAIAGKKHVRRDLEDGEHSKGRGDETLPVFDLLWVLDRIRELDRLDRLDQ